MRAYPPSGGPDWAAGPVTRRGLGTRRGVEPGQAQGQPVGPAAAADVEPSSPTGRPGGFRLWWFGAAAAAVLVVGLVVALGLTVTGEGPRGPFGSRPEAPPDVRAPLAKLCPSAPVNAPEAPPTGAGDPAPASPRTVDETAGISYRRYGAPWQPWDQVWSAGTLEVPYKVGQHFITESNYAGGSDYHASILSGAVPAAVNDALTLDLACIGRQVAADVRAEYYPQPARMEVMRDEVTTLGGRPAWVTKFRMHFDRSGLRAKDELAAVACIDVGRTTAAVFYVSIPGTHHQFDWVVDDALASVRPI